MDTNPLPHFLRVSSYGVAAPCLNMLFKDMNAALPAEDRGINLQNRSLKGLIRACRLYAVSFMFLEF
jgi:hypothetical protein